MNPSLTYGPAYFGLFAALTLAIACNAFLDIQYGVFGTEIFLWSITFAWTLNVGRKQLGIANETGRLKQRWTLIIGGVISVIVFIPMWGFPRAGLYVLAVLQASMNCVTTTRRQLHIGLLVSAVMVTFAASHYRADWTMLFYLVPYVAAVVFTLVSVQINQRIAEIHQTSVGIKSSAGQGAAILAASSTILLISIALYLATPKVTWPYLEWRYGQMSNLAHWNGAEESTSKGRANTESSEGGLSQQPIEAQDDKDAESANGAGSGVSGAPQLAGSGWPTPKQMRDASNHPGMPQWQAGTIRKFADASEGIHKTLQPVANTLKYAWERLKQWFEKHRSSILKTLFGLLLLALLIAIIHFLRKARVAAWMRTRYDYLRLGLLAPKSTHDLASARPYYAAMERLLKLHDIPRLTTMNTQEYLCEITRYRHETHDAAAQMTHIYEELRYGLDATDSATLNTLRQAYRQLFQKLK